MRFGISYGNHGNGVHVEDITTHIRNALRLTGHEAFVLPNLLRDGINVVLEGFDDLQARQIAEIRRRTSARFIVVVSEFTDGKTFNSHITSGQGHYVDQKKWRDRFVAFLEVASSADAIWTLSEYQVSQYRELLPDMPVAAFPIGFDPLLLAPQHTAAGGKDIDLIFTGNETPHRKQVMVRLAHHHNVLACPVSMPTIPRIDMIARSKASLHINLTSDQRYTSIMRHHFLLMHASPVLSECAGYPGELDEFVTQFTPNDFVAGVNDFMVAGAWQDAGTSAYERYRESRPLAPAVAALLADTLPRR